MSTWSKGRCPRCRRTIHIESGCLPECSWCGPMETGFECAGCGERHEHIRNVQPRKWRGEEYGHICLLEALKRSAKEKKCKV